MKIEEYGKEHDRIIVMLHGANFVHCFGRQYVLAERYRSPSPRSRRSTKSISVPSRKNGSAG